MGILLVLVLTLCMVGYAYTENYDSPMIVLHGVCGALVGFLLWGLLAAAWYA